MQPTNPEQFEDVTGLILDVVIDTVLERADYSRATPEQWNFFRNHINIWIRWFDANNKKYRRKMRAKSNSGRDFVYILMNHWLNAFMLDPTRYIERHPISSLN